jgi:hypothetical protein
MVYLDIGFVFVWFNHMIVFVNILAEILMAGRYSIHWGHFGYWFVFVGQCCVWQIVAGWHSLANIFSGLFCLPGTYWQVGKIRNVQMF